MAYDVVISNTTYEGIDTVQLPLDGGGNAAFVDGETIDKLLNGTITSISLGSGITSNLRQYAFQGCTALTTVSAPTLSRVQQYTFQGCTALTNVDFWSNLTVIYNYAFQGCTSLSGEINLPAITGLTGTNAFQGCTGITKFVFGFTETGAITNGVGTSFKGCTALKTVDLGFGNKIDRSAFEGCTVLDTLILRRTAGIVSLANATPFLNGTTDVTVYVPSDLIATYQADSNWAAQTVVTFSALENSAYA